MAFFVCTLNQQMPYLAVTAKIISPYFQNSEKFINIIKTTLMSYTNIVQIVKERAVLYGNREVFRFKDKTQNTWCSYSWDSLIREVELVSGSLMLNHFGAGSNIGIWSDNCKEWIITDLGIIGIRGVVVPFFSTSSKQQVKYIVDETQMELLFVGNSNQVEKAFWLLENCPSLKKIIVFEEKSCPDDCRFMDWLSFCQIPRFSERKTGIEEIIAQSQADDLLTIIYTSGTTGEPKGVMLTHANYLACFRSHDKRIIVTPEDVSLCFLPLSHVFERTWTYYLLYKGAVNAFLENPKDVVKTMEEVNPTLMCTVPRFYEKTYEGIQAEASKWPVLKRAIFNWAIAVGKKNSEYQCKGKQSPFFLKIQRVLAYKTVFKTLQKVFGGKIRYMPCAGSAIRNELLRFFHAAEIKIIVGYGTTETTATVSCFKDDVYNFNSVGNVMPDVEVKISEKGEILVKGPTVFKGYFRKPLETEAALKDGWYHTGDKGAINPDGSLLMIDRIKDLFKTSVGKYISPQKIELLMGEDPFIEQIICIGDDRKYVTALVVPSFHGLKALHSKFGLSDAHSELDFCNSPSVYEFMKGRIERLQSDLTNYEKIVKFSLIPESFTIENNALTSSLKIKRRIITEKYQSLIESMY